MGNGRNMLGYGKAPRHKNNVNDGQNVTTRGFTNHEHLDEVELIHMNGRVYDYNLGRFMGVDPFIVGSENTQAINPYSYVLNNPLAFTDPSGYSRVAAMRRKQQEDHNDMMDTFASAVAKHGGGNGSKTTETVVMAAATDSTDIGSNEQISKSDNTSTNVGGAGDAGFDEAAQNLDLSNYLTAGFSSPQSGSSDNSWSFGDPLPQGVVDFAAGWGDTLSFGLTSLIRTQMGTNGAVNQDSASYYGGMGFGAVNGLGYGWAAGLNGGAKTVFWSGTGNLGRAGKLGTSLERTPIGALMNKIGEPVPYFMWKAASATFAANAKGTAIKVGAKQGNIWSKIEKPILEFRNIPVKQIK